MGATPDVVIPKTHFYPVFIEPTSEKCPLAKPVQCYVQEQVGSGFIEKICPNYQGFKCASSFQDWRDKKSDIEVLCKVA